MVHGNASLTELGRLRLARCVVEEGWPLRSAGVARATRLLAVGPSDAVNAEIVSVAQTLAADRSGAALCRARISDSELCALLRIQEADLLDDPLSSSLEFFNIDESSARSLLTTFPFAVDNAQPHILVSRFHGLGTWLVTLAAALWCAERTDVRTRLWITVVDDHAEERIGALGAQYPGVNRPATSSIPRPPWSMCADLR